MDIHIQNPHKKVGGPLLAALAAAICSLLLPNCEGSHSVRLFKSGSPSDPSNYRPISPTCTCCKVLETIIASDLLEFLHTQSNIEKSAWLPETSLYRDKSH